jgi:hypothetical protein
MGSEENLDLNLRRHPIGLERLKEYIERTLPTSDLNYGVRFENESAGLQFAYSWAAIWSEN